MAFCVPFPLWQRTSRIYQDHRRFPSGVPHFLRPACPYPGCRPSFLTGSCPTENIPADYWLILCCLLTPVPVLQHLSADVPWRTFSLVTPSREPVTCLWPDPDPCSMVRDPGLAADISYAVYQQLFQAASGLRISFIIFAGSYFAPVFRIT